MEIGSAVALFSVLPERLAGVLFAWSPDAFGACVAALEQRGAYWPAQECPCRSVDGAWAIVASDTGTGLVGRQLMGTRPWVVLNMAYYRHVDPLEFFARACGAMRDRQAPLVSLNTPESVLDKMRLHEGRLPPSVEWLAAHPEALPEWIEAKDAQWWRDLLESTQVDLHVMPYGFDPEMDTPPVLYWEQNE